MKNKDISRGTILKRVQTFNDNFEPTMEGFVGIVADASSNMISFQGFTGEYYIENFEITTDSRDLINMYKSKVEKLEDKREGVDYDIKQCYNEIERLDNAEIENAEKELTPFDTGEDKKVLIFEEGTKWYDSIVMDSNTNFSFFNDEMPSRIVFEYDN
jgi:hypothetical protein